MIPAPPHPLPAPPKDSVPLPAFPPPARILAVLGNQVGGFQVSLFSAEPFEKDQHSPGRGPSKMITALKAMGLLPQAQGSPSHPADTSTLASGHS